MASLSHVSLQCVNLGGFPRFSDAIENVFNPFFHLLLPCRLDFECNQISLESGAGWRRRRGCRREGSSVRVDFSAQRRQRRLQARLGGAWRCVLAVELVCASPLGVLAGV